VARNSSRAVIVKDDKVLMIERYKNGRHYYVFPGGGMEDGENPEGTVVRELQEELNLKIDKPKLIYALEEDAGTQYFYLVKDYLGVPVISGEEKERSDENNVYLPGWFDISSLKDLDIWPELIDNIYRNI
jgi:8-oxo-dGTP pyrophosphatase MutT (NUDIX family)